MTSKYYVDGIPYKEYCKMNGVSYNSAMSTFRTKYKNVKHQDEEEILRRIVMHLVKRKDLYLIDDMDSKEYCQKNGVNYEYVIATYNDDYKGNSNLSRPEAIKAIVEELKKSDNSSQKEMVYDEPLLDLCRRKGVSYTLAKKRYSLYYKKRTDITKDDAYTEIINTLKKEQYQKEKTYTDGLDLKEVCEKRNYPYVEVLKIYNSLERRNPSKSESELIEEAVRTYKRRINTRRINNALNDLNSNTDINQIISLCNRLNIDIESVLDIHNQGYSLDSSLKMVWFFADYNKNKKAVLSERRLRYLEGLVLYLKDVPKLEKIKLSTLLFVYKSGLYDTRHLILLKDEGFLNETVNSVLEGKRVENNMLLFYERVLRAFYLKEIESCPYNNEVLFINTVHERTRAFFKKYVNNTHLYGYSNIRNKQVKKIVFKPSNK